MAETTSRNRSQPHHHTFQRSISPSGRFCSSSSSAFTSSTPAFSSHRSAAASLFHRPTSPTRVNLSKFVPSTASSSVRFFIDRRPTSPGRSFSVNNQVVRKQSVQKKTCMCSPTTHPGSFRCSLHKNGGAGDAKRHQSSSYQPHRLHMRRSAMTNSLVRIGTVEGEWVKRALATLVRPSSHQQRRRADYHPRPSRLSIMSKAEDL